MLRVILQHLITVFANKFKDLLFVSIVCLLFLCINKRSPSILIPVGEDGHLPFQGVDSKMNQV